MCTLYVPKISCYGNYMFIVAMETICSLLLWIAITDFLPFRDVYVFECLVCHDIDDNTGWYDTKCSTLGLGDILMGQCKSDVQLRIQNTVVLSLNYETL